MLASGLVSERRVLGALAKGILRDAYRPEVPERVLAMLGHVPSAFDRRQLLASLRLLDTRAGALLLTGRAVPASWLSPGEAEAVVQKWKGSRVSELRRLARAIEDASLFALYGYPSAEWERIGYPGPLGPPPDEPKRIHPEEIESDEVLACDVAIVGSGAAGGCVAAGLASRGADVVVLEKGGYFNEADFTHLEAHASRELYLYGKMLATHDLGVRILAGSALGGGTLVNFATAFRTPDDVLRQWTEASGIDAFASGEFGESLDAVSARIGVTTDASAASRRDQLLEEGLKGLGWHVDNMPRAVSGCTQDEGCGYCGFGCRVGGKRSALKVYIEDAARRGARVITGTDVRKVSVTDGRATGLEAVARGRRLRVDARAIVVAGGAIESAGLLLRSGVRGQVGRNLHLHPGTAVWGLFDEEVNLWEGTTQARYSMQLRHWDGGFGPLLETIPVHPGEFASAIPWTSAAAHREIMRAYPNVGFCAVLPRDAGSGRVLVDRAGQPKVHYRISSEDGARIVEGLVAAAKVMEAAGASRISSLHEQPLSYRPSSKSAHERWASEMRARGVGTESMTFYSYHQMGSCRMGVDPETSVVGPDNESHEVANLFVVDSSAFPAASGVNPMLTVYAIAHRATSKIAARLH